MPETDDFPDEATDAFLAMMATLMAVFSTAKLPALLADLFGGLVATTLGL